MQKTSRFTKFLRIVLGLSIFLTLFFQLIKPSGLYQKFDQSFFTVTSYLKHVLFQSPIESINEAITGFVELKDVHKENETLRLKLLETFQLETRLIESNKENVELKNLLDLQQTLTDVQIFNANVIQKDSTNFNNTLLINKGSNDGIELYMPVIIPSGLIGQISEVSDNTSIVTLLTSSEGRNQFALKIQMNEQNTVEAIFDSYNPDTQKYQVRLLDSTQTVTPKMKVVTSGMGSIIPAGLLVGEIVEVEESPATLSIILQVQPSVSYSNINAVMIVSKP